MVSGRSARAMARVSLSLTNLMPCNIHMPCVMVEKQNHRLEGSKNDIGAQRGWPPINQQRLQLFLVNNLGGMHRNPRILNSFFQGLHILQNP